MKSYLFWALAAFCFTTVACDGGTKDFDPGCRGGSTLVNGACVADTVDAGSPADAGSDAGTTLPSWCLDQDGDGFPMDPPSCVSAATPPEKHVRADAPLDCDDTPVSGVAVNPGQEEILGNGKNDDCDLSTPDTVTPPAEETCVVDPDTDGFHLVNAATFKVPAGQVCPSLHTKQRTDGKFDCVEGDNTVNPGKTEVTGNGKDDDCDPLSLDNPNAPTQDVCKVDLDGDGYHLATASTWPVAVGAACPGAYSKARTDGAVDCDDTNAAVTTVCASLQEICKVDADTDGYHLSTAASYPVAAGTACPAFHSKARTDGKIDCLDTDNTVNPGRTEVTGNGKNDDCDATTPDGTTSLTTYCPDQDGDTYPLGGTSCLQVATAPTNYIAPRADGKIDCVDNDAAINPGRTEQSNNGKNDDCNDTTPDVPALGTETCYRDQDIDGFGITSDTKNVSLTNPPTLCESGYIKARSDGLFDCVDTNAAIKPGAPELCDGVNNNCAGAGNGIDEGWTVGAACDGDHGLCRVRGVVECASTIAIRCSVNPGGSQFQTEQAAGRRTEIPNDGVDQDCSGADATTVTPPTTVTDAFRYTAPSGYVVLSGTVSQCADQTCTSFTGGILAGTANGNTFTFSQVRARGSAPRFYRVNVNLAREGSTANTSWSCLGANTVNGPFDGTGAVGTTLVSPTTTVSNGSGGCEPVVQIRDT